MKHVVLNGQLMPEADAKVSIFDRGFLYGDGLFETMWVAGGRPFRWADHLVRLRRGAEFLKIRIPFNDAELGEQARRLIERNEMLESVLRLTLSRGVGVRGYSPRGAEKPVLAMTLSPAPVVDEKDPPRWRVVTASFRLPAGEALAQFKTCNKLPQIMARSEADERGADEALLLNTRGEVVEGSSSNLFWVRGDAMFTPPLEAGILAGVTRMVVREICGKLSIPLAERAIMPGELAKSDGVFLSLSTLGVVQAASVDGVALRQSPVVEKLRKVYLELVRAG